MYSGKTRKRLLSKNLEKRFFIQNKTKYAFILYIVFVLVCRMSVSKPITAKDLQEFSQALQQNALLKYQMGSHDGANTLFIYYSSIRWEVMIVPTLYLVHTQVSGGKL